jgi:hypothetical protein
MDREGCNVDVAFAFFIHAVMIPFDPTCDTMMLHVQHFVLQDIQQTSSNKITWIKWDTM